MVEVRTFEGDAAEASRFTNRVWQASYGGKVPLALWDERYFDWLLFGNRHAGTDFLLGAYLNGKLVGTLFAERTRIRLGEGEVDGTFASWASVDTSHRGLGIGRKLAAELLHRHRERGARLALGCVAHGSEGAGFWGKNQQTRFMDEMGLWIHVFEPEAMTRWSFHRSERAFFRLLRPFQRHSYRAATKEGIRLYRPTDLPQCTALIQHVMKPVTFGYAYTTERLAHQLQYRDMPRTFVLERDGVIQGLVNYYTLQLRARETRSMGVVDLMAFKDGVSPSEQRRLLQVTMQDMEQQGVSTAAMLRLAGGPSKVMWRSGWLPWLSGGRVACLLPTSDVVLPASPRVFTHLR
ncbi:GNAT family N-acetyltransferase [Corallococcus sp. H22C18031201]|uniref:GNAT family N-acetyltransferase n=1 Tax=Citreicoccus inhibens TaxID=2849499 RepID=UPI000E720529|nr:GNAT family N-acetyltransferase [Citreicoccus inhibens]MBU8895680.1 GNAT family N-acetyltransferase [Citreicoccus inhibens]RJS20108.1 GNAT family N-acetyltransferase [Corallococcus sp. H22C18031201]